MSDTKLQAVAAQWNLLDHSFYRRWVAGELTMGELQEYACQYNQVVEAIPRWLRQAAVADADDTGALSEHAAVEASHVPMWAEFSAALGVSAEALAASPANAATRTLLDAGDELAENGLGAAVVWALEAQTPAVSVAKLDGLRRHYGIDAGTGGRYFDVHRAMDVEHAAELEEIVASHAALAQAAPAAAATVLERLWNLLSSVETVPA